MNSVNPLIETRALFSIDGKTWHDKTPVDWQSDDTISKIVIGQPPQDDRVKESPVSLANPFPENLADLYPNLTHLYLWQVNGLELLPNLPANLECLDVRGGKELKTIVDLPQSLDTLVLDYCDKLEISEANLNVLFPALRDFSIRESVSIHESWIQEVVKHAKVLQKVDLSGCYQLHRISSWSESLVDIRLDNCDQLKLLPKWPSQLRRINLRSAVSIQKLQNLPESIDYIDLAYTRSLRKLPHGYERARTLFLYDSGIHIPPDTEKGSDDEQNVAEDVAAYFEDVQSTGRGEIKRCKLLILGNGEAGKTCLSLNLTGGNPKEVEKLGSTHGIQFWDWNFEANVDSCLEPVHLHLWDFGGQEIYHNTHRLFMSKGTVFIVVWNPNQDGQHSANQISECPDEWHSLRYWFDFIHMACGHKPRIALVCSNQTEKTDELEQRWRKDVGQEYQEECECYYIDSWDQVGETQKLKNWLQDEVGDVISSQGTVVPIYWEIAQELIEEWIGRLTTDKTFAATHQTVTANEFKMSLETYIEQFLINHTESKYDRLRSAITSGEFELTEDRMRRTLNFLTRSGWIYWDPNLFENRVIIGQQWALDGLYTILERRQGTEVYRNLIRSNGRFTISDLGHWAWDQAGYSPNDQKLLTSFMEECGLCFQLRKAADAWRAEDVYISIEHLPTSRELRLQRQFDTTAHDLNISAENLEVPQLHNYEWIAYLAEVGQQYGSDATYAEDALLLKTDAGETIFISCFPDQETGIGAELSIQVASSNNTERLKQITESLRRRFPRIRRSGQKQSVGIESLGKAKPRQEIFISYSWNSKDIPEVDYEEPVDAIERFLHLKNTEIHKSLPENWDIKRDKHSVKEGDSIVDFMKNGVKAPIIILVHSDRYWKSPNCMYELFLLEKELSTTSKSFQDTVVSVELESSQIKEQDQIEEYLEFWKTYSGKNPSRLGLNRDDLKSIACATIIKIGPYLDDSNCYNLRWDSDPKKVFSSIEQRLITFQQGDEQND